MRAYPRDILFTVINDVIRFQVPVLLPAKSYTLSLVVQNNEKHEFQNLFYQILHSHRESALYHTPDSESKVCIHRGKVLS